MSRIREQLQLRILSCVFIANMLYSIGDVTTYWERTVWRQTLISDSDNYIQ